MSNPTSLLSRRKNRPHRLLLLSRGKPVPASIAKCRGLCSNWSVSLISLLVSTVSCTSRNTVSVRVINDAVFSSVASHANTKLIRFPIWDYTTAMTGSVRTKGRGQGTSVISTAISFSASVLSAALDNSSSSTSRLFASMASCRALQAAVNMFINRMVHDKHSVRRSRSRGASELTTACAGHLRLSCLRTTCCNPSTGYRIRTHSTHQQALRRARIQPLKHYLHMGSTTTRTVLRLKITILPPRMQIYYKVLRSSVFRKIAGFSSRRTRAM